MIESNESKLNKGCRLTGMNFIETRSNSSTLILFLSISLLILLFIGQNQVVEPGSLLYWFIVLPALLIPLTKLNTIACTVFLKTWPILLMVLFAALWGLMKQDIQVVFRLVLFLLVLSWLEVSDLTIKVKTLSLLYIGAIFIAILVYSYSDINHWGLLPGTTDRLYGIWRVSFFPNIANTGFVSLFIFMVCTKDKETLYNNKLVVCLALYFTVFSFVRSAVISLVVYVVLRWLFSRIKNYKLLFMYSLIAALILNIVVGYAGEVIHHLQSIPLINRLLLRGEHALTQHEIYVQMYRPWVWKNQWNIFIHSPFWMGVGAYDFNDYISSGLRSVHAKETDSVSLLLGMLASYGLPALLFFYYIINKCYQSAVKLDIWACSIFPIIIFICMQWGSIFHPACATFILFFLILLRGKKAFI